MCSLQHRVSRRGEKSFVLEAVKQDCEKSLNSFENSENTAFSTKEMHFESETLSLHG